MTPPPARRIVGTTAFVPRNDPVRMVPTTVCHISSVWSSKLTRKLAPALLHRMETEPNACSVAATAAAQSSARCTSSRTPSARPPAAAMSRTTVSALSANRSATHTAAPSRANSRAWAPPIAPPPPVMTATLPLSLNADVLRILVHVIPGILQVQDLRVWYHTPRGAVKAVDGLTFSLLPDERLGLVGESGSGKSTIALALMRLIRPPGKIESGEVWLDGVNVLELSEEQMRRLRLASIALVAQGAMNSLNPVIRVREQIADAMRDHDEKMSRQEVDARITSLLEQVGLCFLYREQGPALSSESLNDVMAAAGSSTRS